MCQTRFGTGRRSRIWETLEQRKVTMEGQKARSILKYANNSYIIYGMITVISGQVVP